MATTANLSVGINTTQAKSDLKELRTWVATSMRDIAVTVDPNSLDREVTKWFGKRTFKFKVDSNSLKEIRDEVEAQLRNGIKKSIDAAFAQGSSVREVRWNRNQFAGSLKNAVDQPFGQKDRRLEWDRNGFKVSLATAISEAFAFKQRLQVDTVALAGDVKRAVGAVSVSAAPVAAAGGPIDQVAMANIASTITASLRPATDELSKAAATVAGVARQVGINGGSSKSKLSASESVSATDKATGVRTTVKRSLTDSDEAITGIAMNNAALDASKRTSEELKKSVQAGKIETSEIKAEAKSREAAWEAFESAKRKERQGLYNSAFAKAEQAQAQSLSQTRKNLETGHTALLKDQIRQRVAAHREGNSQFAAFVDSESKIQKKFDSEVQAGLRTLREEQKTNVRQAKELAAEDVRSAAARQAAWKSQEKGQKTSVDPWAEIERERLRSVASFESQHSALKKREEKSRSEESRALNKQSARQIREQEEANAQAIQAQQSRRFQAMRQARKAYNDRIEREEREHLARMRRYYENSRVEAGRRFSGIGPSVKAAAMTAKTFGRPEAEEMLGPTRVHLLDQVSNLRKYRRAADEGAASTKHLGSATTGWAENMRQAHSGARGLLGTMGAMWLTWGSIVPLLAGAAVGQAFRTILTTGKDLEYQLKFVQVLSNGAKVSMAEFNDVVAGSAVGPVEAANALRGLAQNGLTAKQAIMALPDVLRLATVGEMDLASAALGATGVMEAFNLKFTDLGRVGDVFAKAAASSNTSVSSMVESMKQASTVADQYKLNIEEVAGSLAVLAQRNIVGSAAGTAFRNMMRDLTAPTEKARSALKKLGVDIFDQNKQVKPYMQLMRELSVAVASLNEQSRKGVLGAIFDERGQKAAENILGNFDDLEKRIEDLSNSTGFMQQVMNSLGDTTEGKIRRLSASFEMAAAQVFNTSEGTKNLVDQLRLLVAGDEFRAALQGIGDSALRITKFFTENLSVVVATGAGWLGLKVAVGAVLGAVKLLTPILPVLTGRMLALGVASRAVAVGLTGGLALVGIMAAEFFLLSRQTNAASEAAEANLNQTRLMREESERTTRQLETRNSVLRAEIDLLYQGVTAAEAKRRAEAGQKSNDLDTREASARARLAEIENLNAPVGRGKKGVGKGLQNIEKERRDIKEFLADLPKLRAQNEAAAALAAEDRALGTLSSQINRGNEFNRSVKAAGGAVLKNVPLIDVKSFKGLKSEEIEQILATARAQFNKYAVNIDVSNDAGAKALARSLTQSAVSEVRDMETVYSKWAGFKRKLQEAKLSGLDFGPELSAALAEQSSMEENISLTDMQTEAIKRLVEARKLTADPAALASLDEEIRRRQLAYGMLRAELGMEEAIAKAKASAANASYQRKEDKDLAKISTSNDEAGRKRAQKYSLKVVDEVEAARAEASSAAIAAYAQKISEHEERIAAIKLGMANADGAQLEAMRSSLGIEQTMLEVARARAQLDGNKAGDQAASLVEESRTAEYGMKAFFAEYQRTATSSAEAVQSVMKVTTDSMTRMLTNFASTGKLSFKDLANTILAEITRIMLNKAIGQFMQMMMGGNSGGGFSPEAMLVQVGANLLGGTFSFANGGIMTPSGVKPLRSYSGGGIARSPQYAEFGEGRLPEAYVPLPDGRTIPVTMDSAGSGPAPVTLVYSPQIQVDSRTDQAQVARLVEDRVMAGNKAMIQHLRDTRAIA